MSALLLLGWVVREDRGCSQRAVSAVADRLGFRFLCNFAHSPESEFVVPKWKYTLLPWINSSNIS